MAATEEITRNFLLAGVGVQETLWRRVGGPGGAGNGLDVKKSEIHGMAHLAAASQPVRWGRQDRHRSRRPAR
jgi:hypothetical protein